MKRNQGERLDGNDARVARAALRQLWQERAALLALLRECMAALETEVMAAGADDVRDNPILQAHAELADRVRGALAQARREVAP